MADVWIMGEMLVEVMRTEADVSLKQAGLFKGPYPSGAPAIFIDTVARLGHSCGIIGGVGNDEFGECLLERLKADGVDCSQVIVSDSGATGVAFVTYYSDGSRKFIFHMGNTPATEPKMPDAAVLAGIKFFHIMGCSLLPKKEFADEIVNTMKLARSLGAKISFDPNIRAELMRDESVFDIVKDVVRNTNVFMPGKEELLLITGKNSVEEAIDSCFLNEQMEIVTVKNGSKGCVIYTRDGSVEIGAYTITPVDATGAGDCFDGAFVSGLLEGKDISEAAGMASAAGALNAASFGPMEGDISPETIRKMMDAGSK